MINVSETATEADTLTAGYNIFGSEEHNITVLAEIKPDSFKFVMNNIYHCLCVLRAIVIIIDNKRYTDAERLNKITEILDRENIIS